MRSIKVGEEATITHPGRCCGCKVRVRNVTNEVAIVEFLEGRAGFKAGDLGRYLVRDLAVMLTPGDAVQYDAGYLQDNNADPREYRRKGKVVKNLEKTLVQLVWEDGLGPATDSCTHLRKVG